MTATRYHESTCKTALNRVQAMPFAWSLNPYRGCTHGCHYCYARATHSFYGMNAGSDFSSRIVVKTNFAEVLRSELSRPSWRRERVAIGTATDAYQPCEGRYRITRGVLEALVAFRTPATVVTKSTLVLRDADLLAELARVAGATVSFTVTTLDRDVWRAVEPGTPPPAQRLAVMQRLVDAGVPCGVFLAPILPGITDSATSIDAVAAAAKTHGASSFGASVLRLAPLVREHYLGFVAASYPELLPRYERAFAGTNARPDYLAAIERRIARIRERHSFADDAMRRRHPQGTEQEAGGHGGGAHERQMVLPLGVNGMRDGVSSAVALARR
ncbi:MAG TPA: radical SAM protein [Thermomicrobiales bacterium]|nr:radical SAM protein [Thermomicrobiales bacterium]